MQLFEAKLFLDSMNSANKKVEKLMSLFPKTIGNQRFFSVFRFGSGLQWLLLTMDPPPSRHNLRPPRARAGARAAGHGPQRYTISRYRRRGELAMWMFPKIVIPPNHPF